MERGRRMRIAIFSNNGKVSNLVAKQLKSRINHSYGLKLDGLNPQMVISIGGDGTLLSAFHHYNDSIDKIRFIGIHTGHLRFGDYHAEGPELIR